MSGDLFENYESEFRLCFGEASRKFEQVGGGSNEEGGAQQRLDGLKEVHRLLDDAMELLEQLELEVRDQPTSERVRASQKVRGYRKDIEKLEKEVGQAEKVCMAEMERTDLFGGGNGGSGGGLGTSRDQRQRLLSNTDRLEDMGDHIGDSYKVAVETEEIGVGIISELQRQRETIQHSRGNVRRVDANLKRSNRVLNTMIRRIAQNKMVVYGAGLFIIVVLVGVILYHFAPAGEGG
eukprot:Nk52_evm5s2542 gene=Nk52_evmTU5s2542